MFSSARPAYHAPARTLRRRVAASLCASSLLAAGITAIGTPVATAQSSQAFGSIADITPESAVQLGTSPKPLPPHANPTVDSGLPVAAPTADQLTPGTVHAEVPLDPSVGLPAAATQQRFASVSYTHLRAHETLS